MNSKLVYGLLSFVITFLLVGVIILTTNIMGDGDTEDTADTSSDSETTEDVVQEETESDDESTEEASTSDAEDHALVRNGCTGCHAVGSIGLDGATTGPDLSNAYSTVESKHGKPIDEYLQEPTSAVMSSVIGGNPLSEEELEAVLTALQEADEAE